MTRFGPGRASDDGPAVQFILPVSGVPVGLRAPTGADDLLLVESRLDDPALVLALAQRLACAETPVDWADLPAPDLDAIIVRLRQLMVGDRVVADVVCAAETCGQRVDLSFGLHNYLEHHRPGRAARNIAACADAPGWFELAGVPGRFRLPTLADQIAVDRSADRVAALTARCIRPADAPRRVRSRFEAAMAALAPPLSGLLEGCCPDCGSAIAARFDARAYCLRELHDRARFVFDDIDALAERYHWSERAILRLPHTRRAQYAERARQAQAG